MKRIALLGALLVMSRPLEAQTAAPGTTRPIPRTSFDGPVLDFDFPGIEIGIAEYDEGPTGATVFHFPKGVMAVVDVRGGAPATINTDALRLAYSSAFVDAISFAGGSSYGLGVATGVADEIKQRSQTSGNWGNIATVAGAIIFDLGGRRFNVVTPDHELGRAALRAAVPSRFPLGARGAGRFALQGGYFGPGNRQHSGQGGAFSKSGNTRVAVFTVVNSLGAVTDREGRIVRCGRIMKPCGTVAQRIAARVHDMASAPRAGVDRKDGAGITSNTTITLVVTNRKMPNWALQRLAVHVHTSMARAIQPFSTEQDGDVLYAVTTGEADDPAVSFDDIGLLAAEVAWDAVLSSVPPESAPAAVRQVRVAAGTLDSFAGDYAFSPSARARVRREGDRLLIASVEGAGIYLPKGVDIELLPVGPTDFVVDHARGDRLRFERAGDGRAARLTLNAGEWPVTAQRVR